MEEREFYLSGKHHLHSFIIKVSVLAIGLAIEHIKTNPGSVANTEVLRSNQAWHNEKLQKYENKMEIEDSVEMYSYYKSSWAVLMDKGYRGLSTTVSFILFDKEPVKSWLTTGKKKLHLSISSDQVTVEKFFGRICFFNLICSKQCSYERKVSNFHGSQLHSLTQ